MENRSKNTVYEFHTVDYMRQVCSELSELFLRDKEKYLEYLKQAMANFKLRQNQVN